MELDRLNLNLLPPLAVLLRTRNVTRAAEQLHVSQSAMSAILGRLRSALSDPLLIKSGRDLILTAYAESLIEPVDQVLEEIDQLLRRRPAFNPDTEGRTFTIIASDYSALFLLRPLLAQLESEAPLVSLDIRPLQDDYAERVKNDEVDFVVVSEQLCTQSLAEFPRKPMFRDHFVVAGWNDNQALEGSLTAESLRLMRWVQYTTGDRLNLADQAMDELGIVRQVEMRTASQLLVPFLLTGTPLVALVPNRLAEFTAGLAQLRTAKAPIPLPTISDACSWHPRRSTDPAHQWLLARIAAYAAGL